MLPASTAAVANAGGCGRTWILAEYIERFVLDVLVQVADSADAMSMMEAEDALMADELRALVTHRAGDILLLQSLKDALVAENADERLDVATYNTQARAVQKRIEARDERIAAIRWASTFGRVETSLRTVWNDLSPDEQRKVILTFVSAIKVSPRISKGRNTFNSDRVDFVWRSGALALAVGFNDDGEPDEERVKRLWRTGTLARAIGWEPEAFNAVVNVPPEAPAALEHLREAVTRA